LHASETETGFVCAMPMIDRPDCNSSRVSSSFVKRST
jgi:hypothetical protein